jgi:hypothetical protein
MDRPGELKYIVIGEVYEECMRLNHPMPSGAGFEICWQTAYWDGWSSGPTQDAIRALTKSTLCKSLLTIPR